ncbi:cytochrome c oxidase subunit II [bacterium CPR1]|nr:cytochrome c oxidase subunit II [bacterium CPR1]
MKGLHSGLVSPEGNWWEPVGKQEKTWVTISFIWCMLLFAMMPLWHFKGGQNPSSGVRSKVDAQAFRERHQRFVKDYQVMVDGQPLMDGKDKNIPVVAPPPGSEVYIQASMWTWSPVLRLQKGATYSVHLSSVDLNHGFSLYPLNLNLQVVPGYDYNLKMTPNQTGEFRIICNEFCGIGHHMMVGKVEVVE